MPKLVFKPVSYRDKNTQLAVYLLIECSKTGFQTLEFRQVSGTSSSYRRIEVTNLDRSQQDAFDAHSIRLRDAEASGSRELAIGSLPPTEPYASANILGIDEVRQLEAERKRATSVSGYVDPRKARAEALRIEKLEADMRREAESLMSALHDPSAEWFEASSELVMISKAGGSVTIRNEAGTPLLARRFDALKLRVAHELGGTFEIDGYLAGETFIVATNTAGNANGLREHIDRARPTVVRRPRRYESTEERVTALRQLLAGTTTFVRIRSARATASPYDFRLEHAKLERIVALLPPADQEIIRGRSVSV